VLLLPHQESKAFHKYFPFFFTDNQKLSTNPSSSSSSPRIKSFPQIPLHLLHQESKAFHKSFFFFFTKNQKLSTNPSSSSSPRIKSFPQILLLLLHQESKAFHKSLSSILGFPLSSLPIVSSMDDIFFNQKNCFQKAIITHATRSISYASSRRPTSPSANLSLSLATNKQTNKTTKTTKQQCFVEQKCQFLSSFGY
jgi:hypothetical protein